MVSIREIKRVFEDIAPHRQLPMSAVMEFQTRIEQIMNEFAVLCEVEAGGDDSNTRLSKAHVKLAFVNFQDKMKEEEQDEEEFGEWNNDE
tara:strand:- start:93 stop:362 length:270 start_codon:yes stop_codon:yes gene_type:complete